MDWREYIVDSYLLELHGDGTGHRWDADPEVYHRAVLAVPVHDKAHLDSLNAWWKANNRPFKISQKDLLRVVNTLFACGFFEDPEYPKPPAAKLVSGDSVVILPGRDFGHEKTVKVTIGQYSKTVNVRGHFPFGAAQLCAVLDSLAVSGQ